MACNFCYNDDVLEWFVYVTINVAIVSFMEWVEWNELQDCDIIITLRKIMFKILALLSSFLLFHSSFFHKEQWIFFKQVLHFITKS
jgi:hypothetical protein